MKYFGATCALIGMMVCSPLLAQEATSKESEESKEGLSVETALTIPSSYVFRGYVIEEDHVIFQPEITLSCDHTIGSLPVSFWFNAWANLTDLSSPGDPEWFNELDLAVGADIEIGNGFTLGLVYTYYNSPSDFFDDVHEVGLTLSHDCWLHPSAAIYRELCNHGGDENTYIELSLTPGFDVEQVNKLHLDFPLTLGLSPDEYYTDSSGDGTWLGYASVGINASYEVSDNFSIEAGLDYLHLCADSTQASNDGDENQVVGHVAFKFSM